jgi:membrane protease YdiL (CAAX protease family)
MKTWEPQSTTESGALTRFVTIAEVASIVISVMIAVWIVVPLAPGNRALLAVPTVLALALVLISQQLHGERLTDLGLGLSSLGKAFRLIALPTIAAIVALLLIGWHYDSINFDENTPLKLIGLPIWALLQQFILQGFIYRRVRSLTSTGTLAIVLTAIIFGFVHLPNLTLTLLTVTGACVWSWVYERAPNLYPLALSHGLASLFVMSTLPTWMLRSLSVGYKYFFFRAP